MCGALIGEAGLPNNNEAHAWKWNPKKRGSVTIYLSSEGGYKAVLLP